MSRYCDKIDREVGQKLHYASKSGKLGNGPLTEVAEAVNAIMRETADLFRR